MDCPNCGAYNASSSTHCRRCGAELHPESTSDADHEDWGSSFTPDEDWSEWEPASEREPEGEPNPWAWSEPEPERDPWPESDWTTGTPTGEGPVGDSGGIQDPGTSDIPNYMWPSIAATLCCCAPLGIPAIVFSSRVNTYLKHDDRKGALAASERAKRWLIASVVVAVIFWAILLATSSFDTPA